MSSAFLRLVALTACFGGLAFSEAAPAQERPANDSARRSEQPADAAEPALTVEEVTDRVEVQSTGSLRSDRSGKLFSGLVVANKSDEELTGRLVVVIDGAGIEGLKTTASDGQLESGESYIEVLPLSGKLKAGERSRSLRVDFAAERPVAAAARRDFELKARVFRIGEEQPAPAAPAEANAEQNLPGKNYSQQDLDRVMEIQNKWTKKLLEHDGVFGTATAENEQGELVVQIYTQRSGVIKELPGQVDGVDLEQSVTGTMFRAGPAWSRVIEVGGRKQALDPPEKLEPIPEGQSGASRGEGKTTATTPVPGAPPPLAPTDPTQRFQRPVPIGVSIFNMQDTCASGTLGARVVFADGNLGILSNAHVLAAENGGTIANPLSGIRGDDITQPGCGDLGGANDIVGQLVDFQTLTVGLPGLGPVNIIDAAVARIDSTRPQDLVAACTPEDGYGFPSRETRAPRLGMKIRKFGRTTGFREGKIDAINANLTVGYDMGLVFFTGQFLSMGDHLPLGQPGDSGSLVVTAEGNHPVGLLFAGAGFQAAMNPIQPVLERFHIAIDDGSMTPPKAGPNGTTPTPGSRSTGRMGSAGGRILP